VDRPLIVLAGATSDLGGRIARALLLRGAAVRSLVRHASSPEKLAQLHRLGVDLKTVDFERRSELAQACRGAACVVSALSGLREVIVAQQSRLLDAAIEAGVPRFIPSDFSADFTRISPGTNRNLDLRREFREKIDHAPIAATSILNGMFMELLVGQAPILFLKLRRVLYWHDADQLMDFTTKDDIAAYTAAAAVERSAPRFLRIAGAELSARGLAKAAGEATGARFRLLRGGSLRTLERLITIMRTVAPGAEAVYPPWQGMQYLHSMFSGRGKLQPLDNARYPELRWTAVQEMLAAHRGTLPAPR
jgi:nucleoside-diphosphate-sugar epimerase